MLFLQLILRKHFQAIDSDVSIDEIERARRKQVMQSSCRSEHRLYCTVVQYSTVQWSIWTVEPQYIIQWNL